ncbi:hypothetical protein QFZ73_005603 [Peribacillus sp. V2I11]|nr:hypothetical protein [Peribacillus sp. V2I11]
MLVRRRISQFGRDDLFVYDEPHHQSLMGVPVPILDVDTPGSYRLRTQYTKNVQSLLKTRILFVLCVIDN